MLIMAGKRQIPETLFDDLGFRMTYEVERVLYELQTEHQHLVLFEHKFFGKMLMFDGATLDMISPAVAAGRLPNIGRIFDQGAVLHLATLRPTQ